MGAKVALHSTFAKFEPFYLYGNSFLRKIGVLCCMTYSSIILAGCESAKRRVIAEGVNEGVVPLAKQVK